MKTKNTYEGFAYTAQEVTAFLVSMDVFIISLRRIEVIQYKPDDIEKFRQWLKSHNIREILPYRGFKADLNNN